MKKSIFFVLLLAPSLGFATMPRDEEDFLKDFKTEKPSKNIQLESYHVSNQFEYVGVEEKTERAIFRPIKTSQPSNFFRYFNFFKKIIKK